MITTAVPRKVLPQRERAAALTAIVTAKTKHKHVGIRPKKDGEPFLENLLPVGATFGVATGKKSAGILVSAGRNLGAGLDEALDKAGQAWPTDNTWEIFGSDDFADFPNEASCEDAYGDGCFGDPLMYGEFTTLDEPSFLDA